LYLAFAIFVFITVGELWKLTPCKDTAVMQLIKRSQRTKFSAKYSAYV